MKHPENEETLGDLYDEMEAELQSKINGLNHQIELLSNKRNTIIEVNRTAKTALEVFDDLLHKPKMERNDLELMIDKITVYEDHLEVHLQSDIDALLQSTREENVVNFNSGIENSEKCRIVQRSRNQKDKVFDVNVISGGDPLEIYTDRDGEVTLDIPPEHFFPWSPDTPFLYDLTVGTTQGPEEDFDTVHSYFALRKWSCVPDAHGVLRFCLNDQPILLNGLLDQGYWPKGLYTPPSDAAVERELSEVKALGFNLLRKHAKIEPQRWYYHCDRLGLVVWQDMVNGGGRYNLWFVTYLTNVLQPLVRRLPDAEPLWGLLSRGKASSRETYRKELQATVEALRCHPCIGCWVPFNEGWGQFDAAGAVQAIRTLDDTRLVDEASGWYDQGGGDVDSLHNYFYPLRVRPRSRVVALSEYGGIAWPMPGHEAPGKTYGYGTAKSREELTARYKKLQLGTVLPQLKKGLSALVYTQLTDVEDEVNGLFTYDRTAIKPDANAVRSVNAALAAEFARVTNPAKK